MKLKDVKVGQILKDKFDNEYIVEKITGDDSMPVKLKCTKFLKPIQVQKLGDVYFNNVDKSFYIYKSKKVAREKGCDTNCITFKSLKLKGESE